MGTHRIGKMPEAVQTFGKKKNAIAVAHCKRGKGVLNVNGYPIDGLLPESMRYKVFEPVLLVGNDKFKEVDIRVKVRGGGNTSQIFAVRQAIAKAIVAYYQKYVDEASKREIKETLVQFDRSLLVADPRRCEPKKFGGRGPALASRSHTGRFFLRAQRSKTGIKK